LRDRGKAGKDEKKNFGAEVRLGTGQETIGRALDCYSSFRNTRPKNIKDQKLANWKKGKGFLGV